jgi:hypothetical protein
MKTASDYADLAQRCEEQWMLGGSSAEAAAENLRAALSNAFDSYASRYGQDLSRVPPLAEETLFTEVERNPHKVKAILQAVGAVLSPDFVALAWRLACGDEILSADYHYTGVGYSGSTLQ